MFTILFSYEKLKLLGGEWEGGCARPPAEPKHLLALGQGSSADLVESGVGNLIGINPRSSVNQLLQDLGHFCVRPAVIGVGTFFVVPQTHAESFLSGRVNSAALLGFSCRDTRRAYMSLPWL